MNYCVQHKITLNEYTSKKTNKPYFGHYVSGEGMCFGEGLGAYEESKGNGVVKEVREPIKERDFDAENRGKVRHGIVVARTEKEGLKPLTEQEKLIIDDLVEFVMSGK